MDGADRREQGVLSLAIILMYVRVYVVHYSQLMCLAQRCTIPMYYYRGVLNTYVIIPSAGRTPTYRVPLPCPKGEGLKILQILQISMWQQAARNKPPVRHVCPSYLPHLGNRSSATAPHHDADLVQMLSSM